MLGEFDLARGYYTRMREQAVTEGNASYAHAAELGLSRVRGEP